MRRLSGVHARKASYCVFLVMLVTISLFLVALPLDPVEADTPKSYPVKWRVWYNDDKRAIQTHLAPLAADVNGDGKLEVVLTGVDRAGNGTLEVLNGTNGALLWKVNDPNIGTHSPFDIVDLNKDGILEIVVSAWYPKAYFGNNGTLYWANYDCKAFQNYNAIFDINNDGYPEIFVTGGSGPDWGYDFITELSYDGKILNQAFSWHPCFGGLTIGDTNHDGRFELYVGDRGIYSFESESYKGGGMGIRAFDAQTLQPLWNDPTIASSSHAPILADVDGDGVQDVIIGDQSNQGIAVYNSTDGSVLTTGGKYRKSGGINGVHSEPTVADLDGDGHLEFMDSRDNGLVKIWDLYDWKLDATLPIGTPEPPKVGYVTNDTKLDIVAVVDNANNSEIFIYNYDNLTGNYDQVGYISGLRSTSRSPPMGANDFTLIQDVDGDGLNELIVSSMASEIICYSTPGPAPNPRARSQLQFYSENRGGAAEYVPPPTPLLPVARNELPQNRALNQNPNPTLSIDATDFQGNNMRIVLTTNASGMWTEIGQYNNVSSGRYSVLPTNMNKPGTTYYWNVSITDIVSGATAFKLCSFTTCSNPPSQGIPNLASTGGVNGNLTSYNQSTVDADGNKVTNIYNYYVNDTSITTLNLPFETPTTNNPLILDALFNDGFESGLSNWTSGGWTVDSSQSHSGNYSAHARRSGSSNYLTSGTFDTSNAEWFTVSFWYRYHGILDDEKIYLQFWNGSAYTNIFKLGTTNADRWQQYSVQTYAQRFCINGFNFRFAGNILDSGEDLWIDDVSLSVPSRTLDYSGYNNHATVHGVTWTSSGVVGGAYSFDGANDYLRIPDDPSLGGDGTWSKISVEFWVKPAAQLLGAMILAKKVASQATGSYWVGFRSKDSSNTIPNTLSWGINNTAGWQELWNNSTTVLNVGSWYHVVCTYESDVGLKIYINGTLRASSPLSGNIGRSQGVSYFGAPLFIGYDGGGDKTRWFKGSLDEVRIYPRALSPSQVVQRYIETKDGLTNSSTVMGTETNLGETWKCKVTPNDHFGDGKSEFTNVLTVSSVQYQLAIDRQGLGNTNPAPSNYTYGMGSVVSVQASPSVGWNLTSWLLNGSNVSAVNPCILTMNQDYNLTAVFTAIPQYQLVVEVSGSGGMTNATGTNMYYQGSVVSVQAFPDSNYTLSSWLLNGSNVSAVNPCILTMNQDYNLTAVFTAIPQYGLLVQVSPEGSGSTNATGTTMYYNGSIVSVQAFSNSSWYLSYWLLNGSDVGSANPYTLIITGNASLTAVFDKIRYGLLVQTIGLGSTNASGVTIYDNGSIVSVQAFPDPGWALSYWLLNGTSIDSANPHTVTMTQNVNLTAVFEMIPIFGDGFESGDFNNWSGTLTTGGGTATVVNSLFHHGSYSAYFTSSGSDTADCYETIPASTELYARGYFYVSQSGITSNDNRFYFIIFKAGNNKVAFAGWRQTGGVVKWSLIIRDGSNYYNVYSASSPVLNKWYSVELHWKKDSTKGIGELWVDGVLVCSASGKNTASYGDANRVDFGLAELRYCGLTRIYCDCCRIKKMYSGLEPS